MAVYESEVGVVVAQADGRGTFVSLLRMEIFEGWISLIGGWKGTGRETYHHTQNPCTDVQGGYLRNGFNLFFLDVHHDQHSYQLFRRDLSRIQKFLVNDHVLNNIRETEKRHTP